MERLGIAILSSFEIPYLALSTLNMETQKSKLCQPNYEQTPINNCQSYRQIKRFMKRGIGNYFI
jgi:hypothetical protein